MCIGSCKQLIYQLNSHLKNAHKCVQQTKKMNKKNTHATVYVSRNRTKEMVKRLLHSCNVRVELWFVCRFHFIHILYKKRNNNIYKKPRAHTYIQTQNFFIFYIRQNMLKRTKKKHTRTTHRTTIARARNKLKEMLYVLIIGPVCELTFQNLSIHTHTIP